MSITPTTFVENPGCVIRIFVETTAIVGGVHAPVVDCVVGEFPEVIPLIATNAEVAVSKQNGWSLPALRPDASIPYILVPRDIEQVTVAGVVNPVNPLEMSIPTPGLQVIAFRFERLKMKFARDVQAPGNAENSFGESVRPDATHINGEESRIGIMRTGTLWRNRVSGLSATDVLDGPRCQSDT